MTEAGRERFCAEEVFESILRDYSRGEASSCSQRLLLRYLIQKNRDYEAGLDLFRSSLTEMGYQVTPYEVKRLPAEIEIVTMTRKSSSGRWIEARFFNVLPSVPDTLLNVLAVALTVGGLVTAPITGGVSIAVSCVAMGFAIVNNSKRETDPVRLAIYTAIGEIARQKAEQAAQDTYKHSALTKPELAQVLGLTEKELDKRLPGFLGRAVLESEDAVPSECYRQTNLFTDKQSAEEHEFQKKIENACGKKWHRLTRSVWVYPSLDDLVSHTQYDVEVVRQGLSVLLEKKVVTFKVRENIAGYWYTK